MADTFKGIITADGKKRQLPYENVLKTPVSDETLSIQGGFADAKVVGDKFKEVKVETNSLREDLDNKIISSANLFDKAKLTSGFYTTSVSGIKISDNPAYKCLLLDVNANETYTATGWGYTFSFYDKNGIRDTVNKVGTSTQSKKNVTFTVPSNAVKMSVNLRIDTNDIDSYMIVSGNVIPSEYIPFQNTLYASPYVEEKDVKEMISTKEYHVGKNQQFTSFIECLKSIQGDNSVKTVYIHEGSYDIFAELGGREFLQTISSDAVWYNVSIIIPPNTKIIGIGLVELNYLPNASLIPSDNAVTCISPINVRGNVSIENITINAKNCRYCIHDEPSGLDEFNENVKTFKNVRCKKIRNDYIPVSKVTSGQAYAAGLNRRSILLFEKCVFESEDSIAWSAHNRSFDTNDGANITIKDCIFIGGAPSYGCVRLGNSSKYKSHSHVAITGCYLNGKFVIKDESTGIFYNTYDVTLLNCTDIPIETSFSTDNEYPVKVYDPIVSNQLKRDVASLKEDINNITEEITIPGWYKIGYYSGEKHNTTNGVSLFFEIPKHVKQIRVVANGRAYFNDYTFINEDDNIVSYGTKLTQDKNINVLIDVPDGATKVVVGGKLEDCDSASVSYKATIKRETEAYIKRLVGKKSKTFFTVGVKSEGSVDNSIYYDVANAISITVNGTFEQRKDIATFIDNNGVLVGSVSATVTGSTEKTISVPKKAKTVYVSTTYQNLNSAVVFGKYEIDQSNLKGKKIVWLGTSIPAGGENGIEVADSYPVYIGKMLDATVYNEAVGSSCLHCKNKNRISERNPYGFVENFEGVSRCLTNTLNEMEWIIAHYNDTDVFTKNVPSTLSDKDKEFIRSCSYEKKINKYLTENNFPDLWIIDHGHNDTISDAQELQYEPMKMPWEAKTGFYQKGVLKTSAGKHLIEIDVDGFDMVYLSGVFNVGYDIYDIIDAGKNGIITGYPFNEEEFDNSVISLCNDNKQRELLANMAVEKSLVFSIDSIKTQWYTIINNIITI
mgnify:CR=1 FL=1